MSQHVPRFVYNTSFYPGNADTPPTDWVISSNYTASGVGAKYQIGSNFNVELLYTNFWRGVNTGFGSTFNIGLKYITK